MNNNLKILEHNTFVSQMTFVFFFIFSSIFLLVLLWGNDGVLAIQVITIMIVLYFFIRLIHFKLAKEYTEVNAKIVDYYLIEHQRYDEESNIPSLVYEVCIEFEYEYEGKKYTSKYVGIDKYQYYFREKIKYFEYYSAKENAIEYLENFLKDKNLKAYVNTIYPKYTVLDISVNKEALHMKIAYIVVALFIGVGIGYL